MYIEIYLVDTRVPSDFRDFFFVTDAQFHVDELEHVFRVGDIVKSFDASAAAASAGAGMSTKKKCSLSLSIVPACSKYNASAADGAAGSGTSTTTKKNVEEIFFLVKLS